MKVFLLIKNKQNKLDLKNGITTGHRDCISVFSSYSSFKMVINGTPFTLINNVENIVIF